MRDHYKGIPRQVTTVTGSLNTLDRLNTVTNPVDVNVVSPSVTSVTGTVITTLRDGPQVDAFHRQRVSNNHVLHSSTFTYDMQPLEWETIVSGTSTVSRDPYSNTIDMTVSGTAGDVAIRQTYKYFLYRAGQSQSVVKSFASMHPETGIVKRLGYFDGKDGIFLESSASELYLVKRSSSSGAIVDTRVAQSAWTIDRLDGAGPSGYTLDPSKTNIFHTDVQWLGAGRVRVDLDIDGRLCQVHEFLHANKETTTYMSTGSLPCRYEISSPAASAGGSLKQICSSVVREGGEEDPAKPIAVDTGFAANSIGSSAYKNVVAVRLNPAYVRSYAMPESVLLHNAGSVLVSWRLVLGGTFSGPFTWTQVDGIDKSTTAVDYTEGSGHIISSGYVDSTNQNKVSQIMSLNSVLGLVGSFYGVSNTLTLVAKTASSTADVYASLSLNHYF